MTNERDGENHMPTMAITLPWSTIQRRADALVPIHRETSIASATVERLKLGPSTEPGHMTTESGRMAIEATGRAQAIVALPLSLTATARPTIEGGRLRLTEVRIEAIACGPQKLGVSLRPTQTGWLRFIADAACRQIETLEYDLADEPGHVATLATATVTSISCGPKGIAVHLDVARAARTRIGRAAIGAALALAAAVTVALIAVASS